MKTFAIAITGTFDADSEEQALEIIGRVEAAGRLALNALPKEATRAGKLIYGAPQRDGYHTKAELQTVDLSAGPVAVLPKEEVPADVTDTAPAS
jgi:hypothetical protein